MPTNLWTRLFRREPEITRYTTNDYINWLTNNGRYGLVQPYGMGVSYSQGKPAERIENSFEGYTYGGFKANPIVFGTMTARSSVFSEARFMWRRIEDGRPGDLFSDDALDVLRRPWPNGTTGELLSRMIQDVDLAGNSYLVNEGNRLRRLRPDWVQIVLSGDPRTEQDVDVLGYVYTPGGPDSGDGRSFMPDEVCHWSPIPDPDALYRGMSWLTPVVREIQGDSAAVDHKIAFFRNGATLGPIVKVPAGMTAAQFKDFVEAANAAHQGVDNAYRPMYVGGGADVTLQAATMQQLDFKALQGASEPLAIDTPIPTPTGWTAMGDLQVGDHVIGRSGEPALVVGVSPTHVGRECYRVTLKDKTSIVADASHLWVAVDRGSAKRQEQTYTTEELYQRVQAGYPNGVGGHRFALPATPVVQLPEADLLVDPYVLGAWLGDGQTAGAAICGATEDLKFIACEIESRGYVTTSWNTAEDKVDVIGIPGGLLAALRALGVLGAKAIPQAYLRASVAQRLDLLRGLMDTDGTIGATRGGCAFSTKHAHLARQVAELVRSLGYRATFSRSLDARSRTGEIWNVRFRCAPDRIPFLLPRKVDRCVSAGDAFYSDQRSIVSIEPVESVPVRCIAVDTDDHLFLAGDGFTPTHNTRICVAARVPAVIAGVSEGLAGSSLNAGNYGTAKRSFADGCLRPLWRSACAALMAIIEVPADAELWYDERDIAFLRDDEQDIAQIQQTQASTVSSLITAGFKPESTVTAVTANDFGKLEHTGLTSVQLMPPGSQDANADGVPDAQAQASTDYEAALDEFRSELEPVWEEIWRTDHLEDDEEFVERADYYNVRVDKGLKGGGRFRKLSEIVGDALNSWLNGDGEADDPLEPFTREQLRKASKDLGIEPRRGASAEELKLGLLKDARTRFRAEKGQEQPSHRLTLSSPPHRDQDVGVYQEKSGKVSLYRESSTGQRGARIVSVDSLEALQAWGEDNGEPQVSSWAASERGGTKPTAKKAPAAKVPDGDAGPLTESAAYTSVRVGYTRAGGLRPRPKGLTRTQVEDGETALMIYQGASSSDIQAHMRGPGSDRGFTGRTVASIQTVMDASGIDHDIVVFRGMRQPEKVFAAMGGRYGDGDLTGVTLTEKGFLSTSTRRRIGREFADQGTAGGGVLLEIRLPAGTGAVRLGGARENEVLAESGLRLTVVEDHGMVDGQRHLVVEASGGDAKAPTKSGPPPPKKAAKKAVHAPPSDVDTDLSTLRAMPTEARRDALDRLHVERELKPLLKAEKLPVSGRKRELVDRLVAKMDADAPKSNAPDVVPPAAQPAEVETAIRQAYAAVLSRRTGSGNRWVGLADIRDELGDKYNRRDVDAALRRLEQADGVNIVPESNQKTLRPEDHQAAVVIGDQAKHAITIDEPAPAAPASPAVLGRMTDADLQAEFDRGVAQARTGDGEGSAAILVAVGAERQRRRDVEMGNTAATADDIAVGRGISKTTGEPWHPDSPRPEPAAETAARTRQATVDRARSVSGLLRDVDEFLTNGASDKALAARIRSRSEVAGTPPELRDALLANVNDREALRRVLDSAASDAGLRPIEAAGTRTTFDPARHEALGDKIPAGTPVRVTRQGYVTDVDGAEVVLDKAVVMADDGPPKPPSPTPRAGRSVAAFSGDYEARQAQLRADHGGEPTVTRIEGGISSDVQLLTYPDGYRAVRKDYSSGPNRRTPGVPRPTDHIPADAEELAAKVLDAFGLPAPAVVRVNDHTVDMEFVDGVQGGETGALKAPASVTSSEQGRLLGLADAVMGMRDRNGGGWMRTDGGIVPIDNGNAFEGSGPDRAAFGNPFAGYLMTRDAWKRDVDVDPVQLAEIRSRLEALRPEFERLGAGSSHDAMLGRLDEIAQRAASMPGGAGPKGDGPTRGLIHDLFDAADATIEAAIRDVYEGRFGPYTTKVTVHVTRAGTKVDRRGREHRIEPSISVAGKIYDKNGTQIGDFERSIMVTDQHYNDGTVHREVWAVHHVVQLGSDEDENPTKYHGKGFGGAFNRQAIEFYRASGVHGISQKDHNGYVWASQGFNFPGGVVPDYKAQELRDLVEDLRAGRTHTTRFDEKIPKQLREAPDLSAQLAAADDLLARLETTTPGQPGYPTAYEISQLGRRDGQRGKTAVWLGKFLGVSADEMILNPDEGEVVTP